MGNLRMYYLKFDMMETIRNNRNGLLAIVLVLLISFLPCRSSGITAKANYLKPGQAPANLSEQRSKVRQIYSSQIGVREQAVNSGPEVEKYLSYVNLPKGNPWCAAFVCWVLGQAEVSNPRSGWSPSLFPAKRITWSSSGGSKTGVLLPKEGDVFGLFFPEKGRIAHVGFVDVWKEPWVVTVEGNTNSAGSREGDGVYRKRRLVRSVYQVARYVN